jgi:serine phosphatase RsbU (regulator of sigma subunit)
LHQTGTKGETQDGLEIALCIIDTRKKVLEFAGANRPLYMIRKNGAGGSSGKDGWYELTQVNADRMPIGIYEQELKPYTNHQIKLKKHDSLYMFSDGYVDQLGGPRRKTFRSKYFKELLLEIQEKPMKEQKKVLLDKLTEWQGNIEQIDDILVVGVKI